MKRKKQELFPRPGRVLELRNVVKRYGDTTVLGGIDLRVDEGQVVTLIGASGSGKSTLLRCVNLLEAVEDGQILLEGTDIADPRLKPGPAQRRMAIVFQAFNLFPHMTALENVALAPRVVHGLRPKEATERAHELLHRVGLDTFAVPTPTGCPAGSSSGSRSPVPWPCSRGCSCSTRSPRRWTPSWSARCWRSCASWRAARRRSSWRPTRWGSRGRSSDHVVFLDGGGVREAGLPEQVLRYPVEERTQQFLARVIAAGRLG